jgi:hypothetical protein
MMAVGISKFLFKSRRLVRRRDDPARMKLSSRRFRHSGRCGEEVSYLTGILVNHGLERLPFELSDIRKPQVVGSIPAAGSRLRSNLEPN